MRILLVEDDELLGDAIGVALKQHNYVIDWVRDGNAAQHALLSEHFDMVILDLRLPRRSGLEVLKTIRSNNVTTPVIILTALDTIADRVKGLDLGADDYMVKKPMFNIDELCARIRALKRRTTERAKPILEYGKLLLSPNSRSVSIENKPVEISRREFALLKKLLENPGRVIPRDNLMQTLYGWSDTVDSNALEVHIHNLRKKFGDNLPIKTVRGIGYMLLKIKKR